MKLPKIMKNPLYLAAVAAGVYFLFLRKKPRSLPGVTVPASSIPLVTSETESGQPYTWAPPSF